MAIGDFVKENPVLIGSGVVAVAGGTALVIAGVKRRKKRKVKKRVRRRKTKRRKKERKRRIIRGKGLGKSEIKHSGRGTKGTKFVSFTTKDGKRVRFKVKGSSKRRKGFVKKRKTRRRR